MIIFLATLFMSLGLIHLDFSPGWWRGQRLRLGIGLPIVFAYVYSEMPALVFPQALVLLLFTLIPNAAYSLLASARIAVISRRVVSLRRTPFWPYLLITMAIAAFAVILIAAPVVDANGLRDVPELAVSNSLPPSAALEHVRVVPEESAIFAGDKVIGQLGAYYRVGTYNIQVENGKLVWVAPLEFHGFVQWLTRRTSPGVIVVSAENPDASAELRQRESMRYIPSALLNENLYRHVYARYGAEQILETTLQVDDHGNPQYLCTLGRPTIGWAGQKVSAVVIVDPHSGAMRRVARADFAGLPRWVRRVYPPDLALDYNLWTGLYVHGWWNAHIARRDVHLPARAEVFGLLVQNDQFVWFVDHTSPAATDQSMTGFTYMDTVSGKMTYYTASGGEFNSKGAEFAVAANPVVRQGKLIPTQPILYNAFGQNTWVVPVVADNGKYQTLALVQAANGHVVLGNAASASPQTDAFASYRAWIGGATKSTGIAQTISGIIDRLATADARVYFTLRGVRRVFTLASSTDPNLLLARPGDRVTFTATADAGGRWSAAAFKDQTLAK